MGKGGGESAGVGRRGSERSGVSLHAVARAWGEEARSGAGLACTPCAPEKITVVDDGSTRYKTSRLKPAASEKHRSRFCAAKIRVRTM